MYVHDSFNRRIPIPLQGKLEHIHATHDKSTRISKMQCVKLPIAKTTEYGLDSIICKSARNWNFIQITQDKKLLITLVIAKNVIISLDVLDNDICTN